MITLVFFFLSLVSGAMASASLPVVKVSSSLCEQPESALVSSGVLLQEQGQLLVVTSSRFILPGQKSCHSVKTVDGDEQVLRLVNWQWNGLSLLKVQGPLAGSYMILGEAISSPISTAEIYGFPSALESLLKISSVKILNSDSDRGTQTSMFELETPEIDRGFVGGLVLSEEGQFLGIVSDQYIETASGQSSYLEFWHRKTASDFATKPLAIGFTQVIEYVKQAISPPTDAKEVHVDANDVVQGVERLVSGDLSFELDCPDRSSPDPIGSYPIGGTDPIGIGGAGWGRAGCIVRVRLATVPTEAHLPILDKFNWYARAVKTLQAADHIQIWYTYHPNTIFDYVERSLIYSLSELVAMLEFSPQQIMTHVFRSETSPPGQDERLRDLRDLAQGIADDAKDVYLEHSYLSDELTMGLLREIYFISSMVLSEDLTHISLSQIKFLLNHPDYEFSWEFITSPFLGNKPELKSHLQSLSARLREQP